MKLRGIRFAITVVASFAVASLAFAGIPKTINYQGYLKNTNGSPVDAPKPAGIKIKFSLYSSNPHRDNPVWTETQNTVEVKQGIYSVELGSVTPITAPFDIRYWLGVAVNDGPEMTPLQPLSSVPYSIKSGCNPGDMIDCYTGTPGTMYSGICVPGLRTCLPDGSGYSACVGEVVPAPITGCNLPSCADMAKNQNETDIDCGGMCPPCAAGKVCLLTSDCESLNCLNSFCNAAPPTCNDANRNGYETDVDCGGPACGPCAIGNHCVAHSDCISLLCQDGICISNPCLDGVKNNKETDVDCGGGSCSTCQAGKTCMSGFDCQSGVCTGNICSAPSCNDGIKNGSETDVDCGGNCLNKCSSFKICTIGADCQSGYCSNGFCAAPTCNDQVKNGNESDVDCGGNVCSPCPAGKLCSLSTDCQSGLCNGGFCQTQKTLGVACTSNNECQSSFCVDGFCCNTACSGTCMACSAALTGGSSGTCSTIPAGTDPGNECTTQSLSSCGTTGVCNGAGACSMYPNGTVSSAPSCSGSTLTLSNTCNGSGGVVSGGSVSCSPYICNGSSACKTACSASADCVSGFECASGACKKASGAVCTTGGECASGACVNNVCQAAAPPDGTPCDDGNPCTVNDVYQGGLCVGVPVNCDDGIACTIDSCNPAGGGCTHTPFDALCDDGSVCNGIEQCSAASGCIPGTPLSCDDGNACTFDACDALNGCQYINVTDGTACGTGLACQSGICTP